MLARDGTRPRALRILYINQDFLPEVGAGPARLSEMGRHWVSRGAEVTVIAGVPTRRLPGRRDGERDPHYRGRWVTPEQWDGISAFRSWVFTGGGRGFIGKVLDNLSFAATGYAAARRRIHRPDVIIASSPPFFPHMTGVALARHYRVPLVLEVRDLWPDYLVEMGMLRQPQLQRALFALERGLLRRAEHVVVVTDSFRRRILDKGVAPDRVTVVPNGVDLDRYAADAPSAPLPDLGIPPDAPVVGYLGTFGRGQALAQVVRAASRLAVRHPEVRVVLVGDGPDRAAVQQALEETRAPNVVLHPPIPRDATPAFYRRCDICLVPLAPIPIFQETIPSKIFEVLASARPFVASLGGEGARITEASGAGIAVPPGDDAALADAVARLLQEPASQRAARGHAGRAWVRAHYDRDQLASGYLDLLTRLGAASSIHAPDSPVPA